MQEKLGEQKIVIKSHKEHLPISQEKPGCSLYEYVRLLFINSGKTCTTHQKILKHLAISLEDYHHLTEEDLDQIETLVNRFARLQDALGSKIFPLILSALQENISMIDTINLLEKRGFIGNVARP